MSESLLISVDNDNDNDYNDYNYYRDSDLDLNLDWDIVVHLHYNANFSDQCVTQTSTCLSMQIVLPAACFSQREIIVTKTWLEK